MADRLGRILPAAPAGLWIGTFHAAAARALQKHGFPFPFTLIGDGEKDSFLDGLVDKKDRQALLDEVRRLKQRMIRPSEGPAGAYQARLEAAGKLDFDALLRRLAPGSPAVIGDPDQAIYGFASDGTLSPFDAFRRDHPGAAVVTLSDNHRSRGAVLEAAKQVIARNPAVLPRALMAKLEQGLPLEIDPDATAAQEAEMIVRRIESLLGGSSHFTRDTGWAEEGAGTGRFSLSDVAVLYRFNAQAVPIAKVLERSGLPFRVHGKKERAAEDLEDYREEQALKGEGITLMTLHRVKGLEFPVVFIAGCEAGVLPARDADVAEERRLFYVGMTRAKERLFLSHARERFLFGKTFDAGPSPFLSDIADTLKRIARPAPPAPTRKKKPVQPSLFDF